MPLVRSKSFGDGDVLFCMISLDDKFREYWEIQICR